MIDQKKVLSVMLTRSIAELFCDLMEDIKTTNFYRQDMKKMMNKLKEECDKEVLRWYKAIEKEESSQQAFFTGTTLIEGFMNLIKNSNLDQMAELSDFVSQYKQDEARIITDSHLTKVLDHFLKCGRLGMTHAQAQESWNKNYKAEEDLKKVA